MGGEVRPPPMPHRVWAGDSLVVETWERVTSPTSLCRRGLLLTGVELMQPSPDLNNPLIEPMCVCVRVCVCVCVCVCVREREFVLFV